MKQSKSYKKVRLLRLLVQLAVLIFVTTMAFLHQLKGGGPDGIPNIHTICPFGAIETLYRLLAEGSFIPKTYNSNIILLAGMILSVLFFGRFFCGWICSLGTLQELFGKLGKKLFKRRWRVPEKADKWLRLTKYPLLIFILYITWRTASLWINPYDPFAAYAHIAGGLKEMFTEYLIGTIILLGSLIGSLFVDRVFCKYLCPLGAFLALVRKISPFRITRTSSTCINCGSCDRNCPANLSIAESQKVTSSECLACLECVNRCPGERKTLEGSWFKRPLHPLLIALLGVILYFGSVGGSMALGYWKMVPDTIESTLKGDPDNIRGWMGLGIISRELDIEKKDLYGALGITPQQAPPEMPIKQLDEHLANQGIIFDHDSVKETARELLEKRH